MRISKHSGSILLLVAAMIWGASFVAQSVGMDYMGPFAFQCVRSLLGFLALLPAAFLGPLLRRKRVAYREAKWPDTRVLIRAGLLCGLVLCVGANLQQLALTETSSGKAGFLTTLYILIVPLMEVFRGKKPRPAFWLGVGIALCGLYFLCVTEGFSIGRADLLLVLCAIVYAWHILLVDRYLSRVDGVQLSCLQFFVAGVGSGLLMLMTECPSPSALLAAWAPLLYAGILSSALAFTLQIYGQKKTEPAMASLIMSLESVFAVLAGFVLLSERPSGREMLGSGLMFIAVLIAQTAQRPARTQEAAA